MIQAITDLAVSWKYNPILLGLLAGSIITFFNTIGAFMVLLVRGNISQKFLDLSLGFAAGLMLTASFTSLILPGTAISGIIPVLIGIVLGALFLDLATHVIPHAHQLTKQRTLEKKTVALWLFIFAITIHNMPEGLSVGIAMGSHNIKAAVTLMIAIGIQNIPEGFAVAFSHFAQGHGSKWRSFFVGLNSGLVEIPLSIFGILLVSKLTFLLPYAMGFGAGAMLYVINNEIIPETHSKGYERWATIGTILGVILMLALDMGL